MKGLILSSSERGTHADKRVGDIGISKIDLADLQNSLNKATIIGGAGQLDASMDEYIQEETYFVMKYPRSWEIGSWNSKKQNIGISAICGDSVGCPSVNVEVFDLVQDYSPQKYAQDLALSLDLQPEFRSIGTETREIDGETVGVVEYLYDELDEGEIKTTQHLVYILPGGLYRYHLTFSSPIENFKDYRELFSEMTKGFTYIGQAE